MKPHLSMLYSCWLLSYEHLSTIFIAHAHTHTFNNHYPAEFRLVQCPLILFLHLFQYRTIEDTRNRFLHTRSPSTHPIKSVKAHLQYVSSKWQNLWLDKNVSVTTINEDKPPFHYSTCLHKHQWLTRYSKQLLATRCLQYTKKSYDMNTHTRLTTLCPRLPRWAGTRKVKPIWILLEQETVSGSGISWAICKSALHTTWTKPNTKTKSTVKQILTALLLFF